MTVCVNGAWQWTVIQSELSCLVLSIASSGSTANLTRIKYLLKMDDILEIHFLLQFKETLATKSLRASQGIVFNVFSLFLRKFKSSVASFRKNMFLQMLCFNTHLQCTTH